ncbi:MAG TPA: fatty acyl-AMP ligase, partial [Polyangiaceae bacterium]|nr:fatty acyl-AMP ligase [Polyangiaceae bacterium]
MSDGEREESSLSFAQLRDAAHAVAHRLSSVVAPGDRVLLFYPSGLDFIVAFLGCLCAGVVAVPVSVPNRKRGLEIVAGVASDSGAKCILSVGSLLARYEEDFAAVPGLANVPRLDTSAWSSSGERRAFVSKVDLRAAALLQYTSGSTGAPRGVVVTHANLSSNHLQQQRCMENDEHSVIVSWLPMFHDMGLGTVLQAIWVGGECVLMSPSAFLQKPVRWLRAISHYRGTRSGGPDFAFDLCARSIAAEEREGLDLSSWSYAYNGSEPVRAATLGRFAAVFAAQGFRKEAFHALYGLAEATLFVTGAALRQGPSVHAFSRTGLEHGVAEPESSDSAQELVGCGSTWVDGRVLIVDPETLVECAPECIGEIWVSGLGVAGGYWGKANATRETFEAYTSTGQGPFLRTGDLGFLHARNLFVTGRSKDLIIVRGRNHYPQDIEDTVSQCHPALEPTRCAAFSVDTEDGESLVVAPEVRRTALRNVDAEDVFRAIRNAVSDRHGLYAAAIVLLRPLALPRTTSGKVRRKACRNAFLSQSLETVANSGFVGAKLDPSVRASAPPSPSTSPKAARLVQWLRQQSRATAGAEIGRRSLAPDALSEFARQG